MTTLSRSAERLFEALPRRRAITARKAAHLAGLSHDSIEGAVHELKGAGLIDQRSTLIKRSELAQIIVTRRLLESRIPNQEEDGAGC
jgi:hypothetical protein